MSPRKSRKKAPVESPATESTPASEPAQISGALDEVIHKAGLVTADQLPAVEKRFVEPKPDSPPPPEKPSLPDTDPDMPILEPLTNGKLSHAAKILAERPAFRQVPEEYFRVASHEREGIRVFKNTVIKDGHKIGLAAIQFAENRQPTRDEKDLLLDEGFRYKVEENLWKREGRPGEPLGDNTIDATRVAADLARERDGLGR